MKNTRRSAIFLAAVLCAGLLFGGCKDLFHPEGPEESSEEPGLDTKYTVTYNANGASGSAPSGHTVNAGSSVVLAGAGSLTYAEKIFNGWNTNPSGTGTSYNAGQSYTPTANITLYAQWTATSSPGNEMPSTWQELKTVTIAIYAEGPSSPDYAVYEVLYYMAASYYGEPSSNPNSWSTTTWQGLLSLIYSGDYSGGEIPMPSTWQELKTIVIAVYAEGPSSPYYAMIYEPLCTMAIYSGESSYNPNSWSNTTWQELFSSLYGYGDFGGYDDYGISNITYESVPGSDAWTLQSDGRRKSPVIANYGITKSRVSFTSNTANVSITIQLDVSSEEGYDFAFIGELDNAFATSAIGCYRVISGTDTVTVTIPVPTAGAHFIDIGYEKDSLYYAGSDCAWFKVIQ
jgi:hypothetical protein